MNGTPVYDVCVIGAGVVGAAIARALSHTSLSVALLEAGDDVGVGTSKANTAILHTGFDATPGSLEAKLLTRGYGLLRDYAAETGIAVEFTGALLVAWNAEQLAALPSIAEKARKNGVLDLVDISAEKVMALEPSLGPGALGGLLIPGESIICPFSPPIAFAQEAVLNGVRLHLRTRVEGVETRGTEKGHVLKTSQGDVHARWVINSAGLRSDEVDQLFGHRRFKVTPRRGELIVFDKLARPLISRILLPVPTKTTKSTGQNQHGHLENRARSLAGKRSRDLAATRERRSYRDLRGTPRGDRALRLSDPSRCL